MIFHDRNRSAHADHRLRCALTLALLFLVFASGCSSSRWIKVRKDPNDPLAERLRLKSWSGPRPTDRTQQWLRRYSLAEALEDDNPIELLGKAENIARQSRTAENIYTLAELSYIGGKYAEQKRREDQALDLYSAAVANAYSYLFDERLDSIRNPYDPQFRTACDLYNGALESSLRIAKKRGTLTIGGQHTVETAGQSIKVSMVTKGDWHTKNIDRIEFVSDFDMQGLSNHYRTFGLGVPLVAVLSQDESVDPASRYYAPGMSIPLTAFLRVDLDDEAQRQGRICHDCTIEFYHPLQDKDIRVGSRRVPLQTDISTPLAFTLNDPQLQRANAATRGLLDVERSAEVQGLYMLEPYDPYKIPVLMVHGLWSNAITWMEMFNDLRADPQIRDNYQFWFYLYPTGQPFWISATQLRRDLREARSLLDPRKGSPAMEQMVLVGHSMGGLLARMQSIDSGDEFYRLVSDRDLNDLKLDPDLRSRLQETLFFRPDPSIKRIVTIATPHRGSNVSNRATQWLGRRLISIPEMVEQNIDTIVRNNRDVINNKGILQVRTSIDSLATDSPMLPVMLEARRAPWVKHHNIVARLPDEGVVGRVAGDSDGIVNVDSASLDYAISQVEVEADHTTVHQHPKTVLEMRRILVSHLADVQAESICRLPKVGTSSIR